MSREILIRLPWPPAKSSANGSQGDYLGKAAAGKAYKDQCGKICMAQGVRRVEADGASVEITFCPPTRARVDWDNIAGRCKRGFDAVAEAVGIDDGKWWPVLLDRGEVVKGGCVLVHIKPKVDA